MSMILNPYRFAVAGGGPAITWNPADKSALIVLSGADLVASRSGADGWQSVRATVSRNSGGDKSYDCLITGGGASPAIMIGFGLGSASLNDMVGGAGGVGYFSDSGQKFSASSGSAFGAAFQSGDTIRAKYNPTTGDISFYKNTVLQGGGPAFTTTPGTALFPMISLYYGAGVQTVTGDLTGW